MKHYYNCQLDVHNMTNLHNLTISTNKVDLIGR